MKIRQLAFIAGVSVLASGCVTHYRYESTGLVTSAAETPSRALIYWYADEGGLWYKKDQAVLDSGVSMRVCDGRPKDFVPVGDQGGKLQIRSGSGDLQTAKLDDAGKLVELQPEVPLRPGDGNCGQIEVSRKQVAIKDLLPSAEPEVIILCKNKRESTSYPKRGRYKFTAVTRTRIGDDRDPTDICATGQGEQAE